MISGNRRMAEIPSNKDGSRYPWRPHCEHPLGFAQGLILLILLMARINGLRGDS
jgi:hypothetical protein